MTDITHNASCHCGQVKFEFQAPATVTVTDCNCSMCSMTGYEHVFIPHTDVTFISGREHLSEYRFNTRQAAHLFCKTCGIKPLYQPRSHPEAWSVNLRCIKGGTLSVEKRIAFEGSQWESNVAALKRET